MGIAKALGQDTPFVSVSASEIFSIKMSVIPDEATFTTTGGPVTAARQLPPHVTNRILGDACGVMLIERCHATRTWSLIQSYAHSSPSLPSSAGQQIGTRLVWEDSSTDLIPQEATASLCKDQLLTVDPQMEALGLPTYPPLPGNTDLAKVEEIRRTIYVGNLPKGVDGQAVLDFFNSYVEEVMYLRMAIGPDTLPCAYAYVEFTNQTSVPIALQNNGIDFQGRPLRIQHSRVAIIKPQAKSADQALEEVEEAIRMGKNGRSRSRSPLRRRRTPSPSPRRKSRSPRRRRSRSRSKSRERKRSRTRSKERKRSRSRDKKRSRSREKRRSRSRERRSRRSRSRDKKRDRSRSRDRKKEKEKDKKDRKRSKSRDRKKQKESKRDHSSERKKDKDKDKKEKDKPKEGKVDILDEETLRERLLEKAAVRSGKEGSESDRESDLDKGGDKTPSRIKNERKRRHSDSD
ncbi:RRM [Parelaphostrongylus tenuis]|uniref:RRM n=1 Tax=Parelaphostrongylus tenuis TaxID=148309 RepID=A0AAD5MBB4_PARTN|nr:RRM [Parelaphostrongylus tenuis]